MTDQDRVKPYHARDVPSGQETADAVADVLKHAAERDEAAHRKTGPKTPPKWMLPLAMNLALFAVYLFAADPQWTRVNAIQPPPTAEQVLSMRKAIYFDGISKVEGFKMANDRLPATLEEAGATKLVGSVDYFVVGDNYTMVALVGEEVVEYNSATMTIEEFTGPIVLPG